MMKHVLLIGDGMADLPISSLGGRTPLEAARTPAMDALCARGCVGYVKTVPDGLPVGSDTAILSIFGCDPAVVYTGRAPLEAAGMGLSVAPGEVAFRANLVSVVGASFAEGSIASHAAGGMEDALARALAEALCADAEFCALMEARGMRLGLGDGFRNIALFAGLDAKTFKSTPPHDILGRPLAEYLPEGELLTPIMEASFRVLDGHPINDARRAEGKLPGNAIWFWGEGTSASVPDFHARYGVRGAVVSAVPLVRGIARLCGLAAPEVPGANGGLDTNYDAKVCAALDALKGEDFAAIHYEAPDECSHAGDLEGKLQGIERFDARIVAPVVAAMEAAGEPYRILVLPDHPTPISLRTHEGQCVPYVLAGSGVAAAGIPRMTEARVEGLAPVDPGAVLIGRLLAP